MKFKDVIRVIVAGGCISGKWVLDSARNPVGKANNSKAFRRFKADYTKLEDKVFVLSKIKVRKADGRTFVKQQYKKYFLENKKKP